MKIKCDVCKTEYSLDGALTGGVKCAICGNCWHVKRQTDHRPLITFIASLCALLSATIFAVAVIIATRTNNPEKKPLIAHITSVSSSKDDNEQSHLVVNGVITNRSDDIYGVPDLIVILHDEHGTPISRQKFMASASLLEGGQSVNFSHTLSVSPTGVKRVTVELANK